MRIMLGLLLIVVGLAWGIPGALLLVVYLSRDSVIELPDGSTVFTHDAYIDVEAFGQPMHPLVAVAISLVPAAALLVTGICVCCSRRSTGGTADERG